MQTFENVWQAVVETAPSTLTQGWPWILVLILAAASFGPGWKSLWAIKAIMGVAGLFVLRTTLPSTPLVYHWATMSTYLSIFTFLSFAINLIVDLVFDTPKWAGWVIILLAYGIFLSVTLLALDIGGVSYYVRSVAAQPAQMDPQTKVWSKTILAEDASLHYDPKKDVVRFQVNSRDQTTTYVIRLTETSFALLNPLITNTSEGTDLNRLAIASWTDQDVSTCPLGVVIDNTTLVPFEPSLE